MDEDPLENWRKQNKHARKMIVLGLINITMFCGLVVYVMSFFQLTIGHILVDLFVGIIALINLFLAVDRLGEPSVADYISEIFD